MRRLVVNVRRLDGFDATVALPEFATKGAAGADIRLNLPDGGAVTIQPGARVLLPTGFAMALPAGFEAQVRPRSGLAFKYGLTVLNAPGTVDADYRGHVQVLLVNLGGEPVTLAHGERIAQMVVAPVTSVAFAEVTTLEDSARGSGGFGSTGRG